MTGKELLGNTVGHLRKSGSMSRKWNHLLEAYTGHQKTRQITKSLKDSIKELADIEKEVIAMSKTLNNLVNRTEELGKVLTEARRAMSDGGIPDVELEEISNAEHHTDGAQATLEAMYDKVSDVEQAVGDAQSELVDAEEVFIELAKSGTYDPTV